MIPRKKIILETSVSDFINNANLITSGYLFNKYDFGIKPAMIRRELNELDKEGYLDQVHPSGGRVPTNKAYRFYVERLQEEEIEKKRNLCKTEKEIFNDFISRKLEELTEVISDYLNTLSIAYDFKNNEFYASGLKKLFESVGTDKKEDLLDIICDFEMMPQRISKELENIRNNEINVYIGKSPVTDSKYLSVISKSFICDDDEFIFLTVGSKRMDYKKSLSIFKFFDEELN
jgi:heat-inducible transcriptional repressor